MQKEVIIKVVEEIADVFTSAVTVAGMAGGMWVVMDAVDKRLNRRIKAHAAKLAFENDLKEGEIQEIIRIDKGIRFLVKPFVIGVALYMVVKVKEDGQYVMRYIGSRGITQAESVNMFNE